MSRNPQTLDLLELTAIKGSQEMLMAITRAERVFSRGLGVSDLNGPLSVLSELYASVHQRRRTCSDA